MATFIGRRWMLVALLWALGLQTALGDPQTGDVSPDPIHQAQRQMAERRLGYEQAMAVNLDHWRRRIDDYRVRRAQGLHQDDADQHQDDLELLWWQVQSRWDWLRGDGQTMWQETRAALERDLARLERQWRQVNPERPRKRRPD